MKVVIYYLRAEEYVVSTRGSWIPGVYADLKAARWAYQFSHVTLAQLTDMINVGEGRSITTQDLREAQRDGQKLRDLPEGQASGSRGPGSPGR